MFSIPKSSPFLELSPWIPSKYLEIEYKLPLYDFYRGSWPRLYACVISNLHLLLFIELTCINQFLDRTCPEKPVHWNVTRLAETERPYRSDQEKQYTAYSISAPHRRTSWNDRPIHSLQVMCWVLENRNPLGQGNRGNVKRKKLTPIRVCPMGIIKSIRTSDKKETYRRWQPCSHLFERRRKDVRFLVHLGFRSVEIDLSNWDLCRPLV